MRCSFSSIFQVACFPIRLRAAWRYFQYRGVANYNGFAGEVWRGRRPFHISPSGVQGRRSRPGTPSTIGLIDVAQDRPEIAGAETLVALTYRPAPIADGVYVRA